MSISLIQESAKEVRRLAVAGSTLAVGDFRLRKLIDPLEQAGAKVPVFAQVAKAIGDLVNGTEADSAARLLALSTLLNAILYTQGQTSAEGHFGQLEVFATKCSSTRTSARALKPLVAALTTAGGGRFEIVKSACERGAFNDLRLIDPAIQALGDNYPELAELVAEKILPMYGPGIVPRLKANFDLKGKKQDARKLQVMHRLDPAGTLELCRVALEDGAPEVKAAAIGCLGKHEECLPLVLEQANSKNKVLRAAALEALAEHDRPEIVKLFGELIKGKALELLARPFRAIRNRQVVNSMLEEGKQALALLIKGEEEQLPRYWQILDCVYQRCGGESNDAEVERFVLDAFSQCEKLVKVKATKSFQYSGTDLTARLATLLHVIGTPKSLEALLAKRYLLPPVSWAMVVRSAVRVWAPDKVYREFASLLEENNGAGKEKKEQLQRIIWSSCYGDHPILDNEFEPISSQDESLKRIEWDPNWLDAAIKADEQVIVCCLARAGHNAAINYLLKTVEARNQSQAGLIIQALARCQYPKVTETFLDLVSQKAKGAKYFDYDLRLLFESARHLPAADLPKLDAFASKLDERFVDKYLEAIEPLRMRKSE